MAGIHLVAKRLTPTVGMRAFAAGAGVAALIADQPRGH
jgi:hypothetical protein